jgi:hypothetical protein
MKAKLILCLALVLRVGLFGCWTTHWNADNPDTNPKLPIRFKNYRELYAFMAARANGGDGVPQNASTVLAMASDTTTEIVGLANDQIPYVYLITPHFYDGGIYDHIRGAQGNGDYYILRPLIKPTGYTGDGKEHGFELIGIGEGNTFRWTNSNGKIGFVTTWHISATEHPETVYTWNGKIFERVK